MSDQLEPLSPTLFYEHGASWLWVLLGPAAGLALLQMQNPGGNGADLLVPLVVTVLVGGLLGVQVKAARIHASVELTAETLRQGNETTRVVEMVRVHPPPEHSPKSGERLEPWQTARVLGELTKVPRGRKPMGVRLTQRRDVQAWARNHRKLREVLTPLVGAHPGSAEPETIDDDEPGSLW
jgi:hypothetical protein